MKTKVLLAICLLLTAGLLSAYDLYGAFQIKTSPKSADVNLVDVDLYLSDTPTPVYPVFMDDYMELRSGIPGRSIRVIITKEGYVPIEKNLFVPFLYYDQRDAMRYPTVFNFRLTRDRVGSYSSVTTYYAYNYYRPRPVHYYYYPGYFWYPPPHGGYQPHPPGWNPPGPPPGGSHPGSPGSHGGGGVNPPGPPGGGGNPGSHGGGGGYTPPGGGGHGGSGGGYTPPNPPGGGSGGHGTPPGGGGYGGNTGSGGYTPPIPPSGEGQGGTGSRYTPPTPPSGGGQGGTGNRYTPPTPPSGGQGGGGSIEKPKPNNVPSENTKPNIAPSENPKPVEKEKPESILDIFRKSTGRDSK